MTAETLRSKRSLRRQVCCPRSHRGVRQSVCGLQQWPRQSRCRAHLQPLRVQPQQIDAAYATTAPEPYWTEDFIVPIPGVTGGRNFGHRRVFNDQPRAPHSGADLKATTGTEIVATKRGRVLLTGDCFFNGKAVFVDHGMGVLSMYLHLSEILVEEGQMVERGELVGLAGATGRVTGPHLHWGVRVTGARVDPFTLPGF